MKASKKILTLSLASLFALTLVSCKEETRNQETPYGNLNLSQNALTAGDYKLSTKELYNRLRYTKGYEAFKNKLDTIIYADEIKKFNDEFNTNKDYTDRINKKVVTDIYGTANVKELIVKNLDEEKTKELHIARLKYIDKMAAAGINLTEDSLMLNKLDKSVEVPSIHNLTPELINYYSPEIVKEIANKEYLESAIDQKEIIKDGTTEKNPNYFDETKDFEATYNSTIKNYNTSRGIVLRFTNENQAKTALANAKNGKELNDSTAQEIYVNLFNNYYNYENALTDVKTDERIVFESNKDKNDLKALSEKVESVFLDELNDEGKNDDNKSWYLSSPVNIDGKFYLIYKFDTKYLLSGNNHKYDFKELEGNEELKAKALAETKKAFINSKLTTVDSDIYTERLKKQEIKIYDPFIENQFLNTYSDYEPTTTFNNEYIFETKDTNYKVEDFYADIRKSNVNAIGTNLLLNKMLYDKHSNYLVKDAKEDLKKSIKDDIKNFNAGKAGLNKAYGEENFLFYSYGYTSENEVLVNKLGEQIKQKYVNDFIYESLVTSDHKINVEFANKNLKYLRDTAMEIYNNTDTKTKKRQFNMNIDHILISIDNNGDGNPDDLKQFLSTLDNQAKKDEFEAAVTALAKEIAAEIKAIQGHTTFSKLEYIVEAFNNNYPTHSGKNWADFKTFKFQLKAESLGDVTETSVNNYVPEFKDYVINMFDKAVEEKLEIDEKNEKQGQLYFDTKGVTPENFEYKDVCKTMFGYHLISLNSYSDKSAELSFTLSDTEANKDYKDLKIMLDEKTADTENDDLYAITDIFNYDREGKADQFGDVYAANKPSLNQVFVYYVEYINGSVHSIKTSIKNDLSKLLDQVIDKFKTASFQEYLLVKTLGEVKVEAQELNGAYDYNKYVTYLINTAEDYKLEESPYKAWYTDACDWQR